MLCTEWDEFRAIDLEELREPMIHPVVIDGRNFFDPSEMEAARLVLSRVTP